MPTMKPSPKPTKSPSISIKAIKAQMPLRSSRSKAPGVRPGLCRSSDNTLGDVGSLAMREPQLRRSHVWVPDERARL